MRLLNFVLHFALVCLLVQAADLKAQNQDAASDHIYVVGNKAQPVSWNHEKTLQAAILAAQPTGTVIIPSTYAGTDCNPLSSCNPGNVCVIDWRIGGTGTGNCNGGNGGGGGSGLQDPGSNGVVVRTSLNTTRAATQNDFLVPPNVTVGTLPGSPASIFIYAVTDGSNSTDCVAGGGSSKNICYWNGSAWTILSTGQLPVPLTVGLGGTNSTSPCTTTNALHIWNGSGIGCNSAMTATGNILSVGTTGTGTIDIPTGAVSPGNPAAGYMRLWTNSGSGLLACLTSSGANCLPSGGGGSSALSALTPATGSNSISSGNNPQTWQWSLTTNSTNALTIGESSASTATSAYLLAIQTLAGSTAVPLNVSGSLTGSQTLPALQINQTWNTTGIVAGALNIAVTNTASNANSVIVDIFGGASGTTQDFAIDTGGNVLSNGGTFESTLVTHNLTFCGGKCTDSVNQQEGGASLQGSNASNTNSATKAGYAILQGGFLTATTPNAAALEGATQIISGYEKGTAVAAAGDVVCATTTAFTVTDCSHTGPAVNIIGVAGSTSNPIAVATAGVAPVKADGVVTIGDVLCMGTTTDGQAHDNGTSACATAGTTVGVVIATSGSIQVQTGVNVGAVTLSTTLPLVQLHIVP